LNFFSNSSLNICFIKNLAFLFFRFVFNEVILVS
jgi:hypothetical protein